MALCLSRVNLEGGLTPRHISMILINFDNFMTTLLMTLICQLMSVYLTSFGLLTCLQDQLSNQYWIVILIPWIVLPIFCINHWVCLYKIHTKTTICNKKGGVYPLTKRQTRNYCCSSLIVILPFLAELTILRALSITPAPNLDNSVVEMVISFDFVFDVFVFMIMLGWIFDIRPA